MVHGLCHISSWNTWYDSLTTSVKITYMVITVLILHGVLALAEVGCWMYSSERQVARLRLAYLRAVLSQEVGAFDTDLTSGKVITGIGHHTSIIHDAIGEKVHNYIRTSIPVILALVTF